ncbi:MAG: hypothetical protein ABFS02_14815, partial [Pseudomonadota bacterium]
GRQAGERIEASLADDAKSSDAIAAPADEGYCSGGLKKILRRVLYSCGLLGAEGGTRGCQKNTNPDARVDRFL